MRGESNARAACGYDHFSSRYPRVLVHGQSPSHRDPDVGNHKGRRPAEPRLNSQLPSTTNDCLHVAFVDHHSEHQAARLTRREKSYNVTVSDQISTRYVKRDLSDFDDIRLNKEQYERVQNLHYAWYQHSIKALMGQMGKQLYDQLPLGQSNTMIIFRGEAAHGEMSEQDCGKD